MEILMGKVTELAELMFTVVFGPVGGAAVSLGGKSVGGFALTLPILGINGFFSSSFMSPYRVTFSTDRAVVFLYRVQTRFSNR